MSLTTPAGPEASAIDCQGSRNPAFSTVVLALFIALVLVFLTRWPVARTGPMESDEFGFLEQARQHWLPMHHTLFMGSGRLLGVITGDTYRGFIVLDMVMSALALASAWWWLRALVSPAAAIAGATMLGVGPLFWGYGAVAGNYTAIIAVGCFLLGVAWRTLTEPNRWHPFAAAAVLAVGAGYRQDIGVFWLPVFMLILWRHRWRLAVAAGAVFAALNLLWLTAMLLDVGGWGRFESESAEFAHSAGFLNSVWSLGLVDGPMRYGVKLTMALVWTIGPALIFIPRGAARIQRWEGGRVLLSLLCISVMLALPFHLLIHFGCQGYAFHYVPALLALAVVGIGATSRASPPAESLSGPSSAFFLAAPRLLAVATVLAGVFLFYPTNYDQPGWRGAFDLSFARCTRLGLNCRVSDYQPSVWRTANSRGRTTGPSAVNPGPSTRL